MSDEKRYTHGYVVAAQRSAFRAGVGYGRTDPSDNDVDATAREYYPLPKVRRLRWVTLCLDGDPSRLVIIRYNPSADQFEQGWNVGGTGEMWLRMRPPVTVPLDLKQNPWEEVDG